MARLLEGGIAACLVFSFACGSKGESLVGQWSGEDHTGSRVQVKFARDHSLVIVSPNKDLSLPAGARLEYFELPEVNPKQLYLKVFKGDEPMGKAPFAIYKFEAGKLVLCMAKEFRSTLGGIPFGQSRYEFPTEFSGACFALERR